MEDGSLKQEIHELKITVALDVSQEDDAHLLEFMRSVPEGFKGLVVRRLLQQSIPKTAIQLDALLELAAVDALNRGRVRGRPRRPSGKAVLPKSKKTSAGEKAALTIPAIQPSPQAVEETIAQKVVEEAAPVLPQASVSTPVVVAKVESPEVHKEISTTGNESNSPPAQTPGANGLARFAGLVDW